MRFSLVALSAALIAAVSAQTAVVIPSVNVTQPTASVVWTVGKPATVAWVLNKASTTTVPAKVTVELFHGDPTHQTLVQDLAPTGGSSSPLDLAATPNVPADWYSVRINGDSYSHYFFIANATVLTAPGPEPGTVVATTAAVPTTTAAATTASAATSAVATATTTSKPSAGNSLSAGSMAMAAVAVVAGVLAL